MSSHDENFVKYVLQTGMATDAQIAAARKRLTENSKSGNSATLSEVMVREGFITTAQRDTVEKKLKAQATGIQQLGTYKLIKKLGEGGMGAVYLAEDTVVFRKVALKVLSRKYSANPEFLARFRREAQALGRLNHPNIVAGFNVGEDKGYQYYVMEYCEGEPLDKRLKRVRQLPIHEAIEISIQVARGLQYAHDHNTIHRDIKPGNLFAMTDGLIKILDMGLSKTIGEADSSFNTQAGVTVGTPHYISPEQARGEQSIDGRADIYSLGATLYHLVTGRTPFEGPTSVVIMTKHLHEQLENPADLRPDCPEGLVQIITKMMAKKANDRYGSCAELLEDLEQVAVGNAPSSPALDPVHSSIGMRSLRIGTGTYKPVGAEREVTEPVNKRATGKREPVSAEREPVAETNKRATGKREPVILERAPSEPNKRATGKREPVSGVSGRLPSGSHDKPAALRKSGAVPTTPSEPLVDEISLSPQARKRVVPPPEPSPAKSEPPAAVPAPPPAEAVEAAPTESVASAEPLEAAAVDMPPVAAEMAARVKTPPPVPAAAPVPSADALAAAPPNTAGAKPPAKPVIAIAAAAVVVVAIGAYFIFAGKKNPDSLATPNPIHGTQTPGPTAGGDASNSAMLTPPVSVPASMPANPAGTANPNRNILQNGVADVEALVRRRDFQHARESLEQLEREVAEKDTYNVSWCAKLDGLDRSIQSAELTLKQEFKKQLIGYNDLPSMPGNAVLLFNSNGSDPRIKWSPRTIKFFSGKLPWVDGQGDTKVMSFEAPDNLLNPGLVGRVVFEYNATLPCDAVVKFQTAEGTSKELTVSFPPGRLRKAEVTPGAQLNGMAVSKITIEINNAREDGLALYRIYLTK